MHRDNDQSGWVMRSARGMRVASVLVILLACFAGAYAQRVIQSTQGSTESNPGLLNGQHLFETRCASCHGLNGKGGERAPDIVTRPEIAKLSELELLAVVRKGIPSEGMPAFEEMAAEELSSLVKYVRSMQGSRTARVAPAVIENGRKLFTGKGRCAECHMVRGIGGFLGPDLSNYAASHNADDIRSAILTADKRPKTRKGLATVITRDGRKISGLVRNEDNFSIQVQSVDGVFHLLDKSDLSDVTFEHVPLMPEDYRLQLSQSALEEIVAYLASAVNANEK